METRLIGGSALDEGDGINDTFFRADS